MESLESLYDGWANRNPHFEAHFKESLLKKFPDYGTGASELMESKGKTFGAGYELYIYAFFLGLYAGHKRELSGKTDTLGHPIKYWGNLENKKGRKEYPKIREYIFAALIAKTDDLDLIDLEKGDVSEEEAVSSLIDTMEQYVNYGFYLIEDKMKNNPNYFYKDTGFLDMILDLVKPPKEGENDEIEDL
ncbi:hypothetical protein EZS27_028257 [termite gut metagenome]|uniref:Glycoside hydrolase family 15 n=1 Tax=termite gut metagenome TaxID=433724 RepID=A0A5J4QMI6_9ZZZZ